MSSIRYITWHCTAEMETEQMNRGEYALVISHIFVILTPVTFAPYIWK